MAWTKNGTVAATNGQVAVTGTGTSFIANKVQPGDAILLADGRFYEIAGVASDTALTLAVPYAGGTASGMGYAVLPTNNRVGELAGIGAELLNSFALVRDTVGQGMFPDGNVAAPGVRFTNDQDTGIRRRAANDIAVVTGGADRAVFSATGDMIVGGGVSGGWRGRFEKPGSELLYLLNTSGSGTRIGLYDQGWSAEIEQNAGSLRFKTGGTTEVMRIDTSGNMLLGASSGGNAHRVAKQGAAQGDQILSVDNGVTNTLILRSVHGEVFSASGAAAYFGRNSSTSRSINAGGTINASGADYAEYMLKAAGCGLIAKGGVCGVDRDGKLTKSWADAISFVVKSTDPSLVGGDIWGADMAAKPEAPIEPAAPVEPAPVLPIGTAPVQPVREDGEDDESFVARLGEFFAASAIYAEQVAAAQAHTEALASYQQQLATHQAAHAQWQADQAQYDTDLADWEAALEAARQCVDRIAFSGQVPCNVTGDFAVGDYLVAAANCGGIKAVAVKPADMTLAQYMTGVGKVWAITADGRAWIDVQHG